MRCKLNICALVIYMRVGYVHFVLKSAVCFDWPAIQCVVIGRTPQACDGNVTSPYHIWNIFHGSDGNNTTARIKVMPSFFAFTFGRCYAYLPTR